MIGCKALRIFTTNLNLTGLDASTVGQEAELIIVTVVIDGTAALSAGIDEIAPLNVTDTSAVFIDFVACTCS